jgi:hypothetical protein
MEGCVVLVEAAGDEQPFAPQAQRSIADRLPRPGAAVRITLKIRMEEA